MSRGFSGGRSGGTGGAGGFQHTKRSAKDMFIKKMKGESDENLTSDERYKKMVSEKMDAYKKEAMKGAKFGVMLPGTSGGGERQMSKSAMETLEKMARDKAKREMKKGSKRKEVNITPKFLTGMQGGRIDADGRIYDSHNKIVASIDKKTGKVKASNGTHICNWSGSSYNEYTIARFLEKSNHSRGGSLYGTKGHGGNTGGGVWGSGSSGGGTDMWGNKKDDGGGFWG